MTGRRSFWNDDRDLILRRERERCTPYSVIASMLGCSKNAAIGRGRRLGLDTFQRTSVTRALQNKINSGIAKRMRKQAANDDLKRLLSVPAIRSRNRGGDGAMLHRISVSQPMPDIREDRQPLVRDIMALESRHCRWPLGEVGTTEFGYCGQPAVWGGSYCPHCLRLSRKQPTEVGVFVRVPKIEAAE